MPEGDATERANIRIYSFFLSTTLDSSYLEKPGDIFLSQGKYVVKLSERFGMVDCKSVTTPMELNFKKLCGSAAGPELGNPTEYLQLVGPIMFLVN